MCTSSYIVLPYIPMYNNNSTQNLGKDTFVTEDCALIVDG